MSTSISTWPKGRIVRLVPAPKLSGDRLAWEIAYYEGYDTGFFNNNICVHFGKDGYLFLTHEQSNNSIYLYPSQAKKLRGLLRTIKQPPIPKFKALRKRK